MAERSRLLELGILCFGMFEDRNVERCSTDSRRRLSPHHTITRVFDYVPLPARGTFCGVLVALSLMVIVAVRVPVATGANFTVRMQLVFCARLDPQLLVREKSGFPETAMLEMNRAPAPRFVSFTDIGALVVPTFWLPKVKFGGERLRVGA